MELNTSLNEPCLIYIVLTNPFSSACTPDLQSQLHVGLYVNNFLFYSSDPTQEELLKTLPQEKSNWTLWEI